MACISDWIVVKGGVEERLRYFCLFIYFVCLFLPYASKTMPENTLNETTFEMSYRRIG